MLPERFTWYSYDFVRQLLMKLIRRTISENYLNDRVSVDLSNHDNQLEQGNITKRRVSAGLVLSRIISHHALQINFGEAEMKY